MTHQELSTIAAILLSLAFSYIPGVKGAFDKLDGTYKRLVMLLGLIVTSGTVYAVSCWQPPIFAVIACDTAGVKDLLTTFSLAVIANQSTYLITPKPATAKKLVWGNADNPF